MVIVDKMKITIFNRRQTPFWMGYAHPCFISHIYAKLLPQGISRYAIYGHGKWHKEEAHGRSSQQLCFLRISQWKTISPHRWSPFQTPSPFCQATHYHWPVPEWTPWQL
jgi:hypothetical protein